MPLPGVCLAPHEAGELAPGEPLCAPATHRIRVWRKWRWYTYYARVFKTTWNGRCLAAQRSAPNSPTLFAIVGRDEHDLTHIVQKALKQQFGKIGWLRMFYFNEALELADPPDCWKVRLTFEGNRRTTWRTRSSPYSTEFKFSHAAWHSSLWDTIRVEELEMMLPQELSDVDSDCAFALRWQQFGIYEQSKLAFPVQRGTREQCDSLLRSIVWSDSTLPQPALWKWSLSLETQAGLLLGTWSSRHTELEGEDVEHPLTPRQTRLLEIVVQHFGLHINDSISKYTVITHWRQYGDGEFLEIKVPPATNHERLEARHQLRDWLRDKVSPEELASLLPLEALQ